MAAGRKDGLVVHLEKFGRQLEKASRAKARAMLGEIGLELRRDNARWLNRVVGHELRGPLVLGRRKAPGERLASRSGLSSGLAASMRVFLTMPGSPSSARRRQVVSRKVTTSPYGATHELGAEIRPRNAKWLTIPTIHAMDPSGRPKQTRARDWTNPRLVFHMPKGNRGIAMLIAGAGTSAAARAASKSRGRRQARVFYWLVKRVTIPARHPMRKAHQHNRRARVAGITSALERALRAKA